MWDEIEKVFEFVFLLKRNGKFKFLQKLRDIEAFRDKLWNKRFLCFLKETYWLNQVIYKAKTKEIIAGIRTRRVAPLNLVAPLQPSCPQVSQNSVLMYDGVLVLMQLSAAALTSSHEHDLETTTLSLTVNMKK